MAKPSIIYVHGVQVGDNESAIKGPKSLNDLVKKSVPAELKFVAHFPAYESLMDEVQKNIKSISKLLVSGLSNSLGGLAVSKLVDLAGDVYVYKNTSQAKAVRALIKAQIEASPGSILVGHSLGSVVCFDVLCDLMREGKFRGREKSDWPIRDLVTFGSPLCLRMFKNDRQTPSHQGEATFHWYNYFDRDDPVTSGNVFGMGNSQYELIRDLYENDGHNGWHIHDRVVNTGFHLQSHVQYWGQLTIAKRIAKLLDNARRT